jgi:hypothetical protein
MYGMYVTWPTSGITRLDDNKLQLIWMLRSFDFALGRSIPSERAFLNTIRGSDLGTTSGHLRSRHHGPDGRRR